jgi:hypothetical protein
MTDVIVGLWRGGGVVARALAGNAVSDTGTHNHPLMRLENGYLVILT